MTANQVLAEAADSGKAGQRREAEEFLRRVLVNGSMDVKELKALARDEDINFSTLKRAKKDLNITAEKDGYGGAWRWELSKGDQDPY